MALQPGSKLGQYEIVSSLGAGGMGEVYRARDTQLGREVAIKLLLEEVSADPERLARFEREARVLAGLNHPNIATLFGFDRAVPVLGASPLPPLESAPSAAAEDVAATAVPDGDPKRPLRAPGSESPAGREPAGISFLVMELVEGETLADRIARGALPPEEAVSLFVQIAEGLEAAHEKGVIHRDLKPANVKVSPEGRVKVLDFGLAKALTVESEATDDPALSHSPTLTLAATQRGEILGTAAYMSPEQAKGRPVDRRTDIWAFGACLFEALCGRRPFRGADASELLAAVLLSEPDSALLPASTPPALRRLVERCLRKDAAQRLHDIADVRLELQELDLDAESARAEPTARGGLSLAVAAVAVAVAALVGAVLAWTLSRQPTPVSAPAVHADLNIEPEQQLGLFGNLTFDLAPDGSAVTFVGQRVSSDALLPSPSLPSDGSSGNLRRGIGMLLGGAIGAVQLYVRDLKSNVVRPIGRLAEEGF
jgi:serine/threonine protein kinase